MCAYRHACRDWEQTARNVRRRGKKIHTEKRGRKRPKEWGSRAQRSEEATETRREKTKEERGGTFTGKEEKDIRSRHPEQRETQRQKDPQKTGRQTPSHHIFTRTHQVLRLLGFSEPSYFG